MTTYDVAVVGGGPAGMEAALATARAGLSVVLIDEHHELGGQYFHPRAASVRARLGEHRPEGRVLAGQVVAAGVEVLTGTTVWAAESSTLWVRSDPAGVHAVRAERVVVATGATERSLPFPGWQHPSVVSGGFAQHLASSDGVAVGARVVVAGSGPFLLPVAAAITRAGGRVVALVEAGHPYGVGAAQIRSLRHPGKLVQFARELWPLLRSGTRLVQGSVVRGVQTSGSELQSVEISALDGNSSPFRVAADTLVVGYGFRAQVDLLRLAGARCVVDEHDNDLTVDVDAYGRTSVPGWYAAGETTGIAGSLAARAEGALVAAAVVADASGRALSAPPAAVRRARREHAFAALSRSLYPGAGELARKLMDSAPDETQLCRCEGTTVGQVRAADAGSSADVSAAKTLTRAGMGPCQGRYCAPALCALRGTTPESLASRVPLRPVPVADLVASPLLSSGELTDTVQEA
ncbi:NAD(P)/FAD-dependent oxidoreductase [Kineosporia succinea]|uniref:Thioredoxin reductase n=1 Tax=Kineosporia succinea TaxID=84632 RepID=A0ABT9PC54_9ACTN|nr:NAD(P)/FAD-dependent oxidoreductase [Kineosporia succinea]MDP9829755.1 thioredoxin reductase [Kineosporia succinea]